MGALPSDYVGYRKVADQETTDWFNEYYGTNLPAKPGLTLVEMMNAAHSGDLKVLYIHGEDPVLSDADIKHTKEALANLDMLIVQELFMTDTAQCADVVFTCSRLGVNRKEHLPMVKEEYNVYTKLKNHLKVQC